MREVQYYQPIQEFFFLSENIDIGEKYDEKYDFYYCFEFSSRVKKIFFLVQLKSK